MYIYYYGVYSCLTPPSSLFSSFSSSIPASMASSMNVAEEEEDIHTHTYARMHPESRQQVQFILKHYQQKQHVLCHTDKSPLQKISYLRQVYFYVLDFWIAHIHRSSSPISLGFSTIPFQGSNSAQFLCQEARVSHDPFDIYERPSTCDSFLFQKFNMFLTGLYFWSCLTQVFFWGYCFFRERHPTPSPNQVDFFPYFLTPPSPAPASLPPSQPPQQPFVLFPSEKERQKEFDSFISTSKPLSSRKQKFSASFLQPISERLSSQQKQQQHHRIITNLVIPNFSEEELSTSTVFGGDYVEESEMDIEEVFD